MFPFSVFAVKTIVTSSKQKLNVIIDNLAAAAVVVRLGVRSRFCPYCTCAPLPGDQWRILVRNRFPSTLFILSSFAGWKNFYHCGDYLQQHLSIAWILLAALSLSLFQ